MINKLSKAARIIMRDALTTIGMAGRKNISRGTAEDIALFHDHAEDVFGENMRLLEHELYIIDNYLPAPPAKILDIGCGGGRTTVYLAEQGHIVTGIDLSAGLINGARKAFPHIDFRIMNAGEMAFPDNAFDAVVFSFNGLDCVAPVASRIKVLREIFRVTKPGGRFYLSSHNICGKLRPAGDGLYDIAYRGYELVHILLRQLFRGNLRVFNGYWWYYDVDGWQLLYSASPGRNIQLFRTVGWQPVAVLSRLRDKEGKCLGERGPMRQGENYDLGWITRNEHHVQYVLEKMA